MPTGLLHEFSPKMKVESIYFPLFYLVILLFSKVCFIIVSSPIERASRNSIFETPQRTQIITPDSSP